MAKPKVAPLASRADVDVAIREIGRLRAAQQAIEAEMKIELAEVKARHQAAAAPHEAAETALFGAVKKWCAKHRDTLLADGGKTHRFPAGEVLWRTTPPAVKIDPDIDVEAVIAAAKEAGYLQFVRTTEELNREAMLAEPDTAKLLAGVTIEQREKFAVEPFAAQLAEAV